ncbi:MAG TPA: ribonuclease III [Candidatus Saccharimonadales bacterium]|nr:ribonuclease III [Candidatus Saccharimonadales bacterium]
MKHLPLDNLEQALGHRFANRRLLEQALTHSSFARESVEPARDNEQLEFLGDAVLQLLASQELFKRFPAYQEGELSKLRAHLVNSNHLVNCAVELKLGDYLRLGRGEEKTGGRRKTALLADSVEALLAALYLDGGLFVARAFVLSHILEPELERLSGSRDEVLVADHKSRLQEMLRASGRPEPRYEMIAESGPDHRKTFTMKVIVLNPGNEAEFTTEGTANSKKAAGQMAAQKALERLQNNGMA